MLLISLLELSVSAGRNGAKPFTSNKLVTSQIIQITAKVNVGRELRQSGQTSLSELRNLIEQEKVLRPETVRFYRRT